MSRGYELLAGLVLLLAIALAGFGYGVHTTNNEWLAKQEKAERDAKVKYDAEVDRGDKAATGYIQEHSEQEARYDALNDQFKALRKRVPLTLPARVAMAPAAAGSAAPAPAAGASAPPASGLVFPLPAGMQPVLTLGSVWMWNSALLARDAPAGACGSAAAAEGAEGACATDSGLDIEDAWDNQAANAKSCADDRQRYQRLIDFLKGRTK